MISGYPTTPGTYAVTVRVNDPYDDTATVSFTWTVESRAYDGGGQTSPPPPPPHRVRLG